MIITKGDPIDLLADDADLFLRSIENLGYGKAINLLVSSLDIIPPFIAVLNTDLTWTTGTFETLLSWMIDHQDVHLAVPQIVDMFGTPQLLCKQNPTLLSLFSRRFIPQSIKPNWLKRYDEWYVMSDQNYELVFEAPYLSGCCMLIRSKGFLAIGGFDDRYFLYLEDADITRSLSKFGKCVHLPIASVTHSWGRGNYSNLKLMLVNIMSAYFYFSKWGLVFW